MLIYVGLFCFFCLVSPEAVLCCICCSMLLYVCLIPARLLDVAGLIVCLSLLCVGHVAVFSDLCLSIWLYVALCCFMLLNVFELASFGLTLLCAVVLCCVLFYFALICVLRDIARGGSMLHMLFDVAIVCLIPYTLLDVAVLLLCLSLFYVGHVVLFSDNVYVARCCLYFAACDSTLHFFVIVRFMLPEAIVFWLC